MKKHILSAVLSFGLAIPTLDAATAQERDERFVAWAKGEAKLLRSVELRDDLSDLRHLQDLIGTARVVSLGEPAHGAHEPLAFRNRLLRYLVEELGFTAIALESALPKSRRLFDFVAGGEGDAQAIARKNFSWGFGAYPENAELLQWIRDYNQNVTHRRKVRLYGIDVGLKGPNFSKPEPTALREVFSYLDEVDPESAKRKRDVFQPVLDRLATPAALPGFPSEGEMAALDDLIAQLERERPAYTALRPATDYAWALRCAIVARQEYRLARVQPTESGKGIPPGAWQAMNARDSAMAENALWALEQEGAEGRILIFAHNVHVMNVPTEGGLWKPLERPAFTMGQYLREVLGSEIVIIGVSSGASAKGLPAASPDPNSLDSVLAKVGVPRFLLSFRSHPFNQTVVDWLSERRPWRANFSSYSIVSPGSAYDACVFFDVLTPRHR